MIQIPKTKNKKQALSIFVFALVIYVSDLAYPTLINDMCIAGFSWFIISSLFSKKEPPIIKPGE